MPLALFNVDGREQVQQIWIYDFLESRNLSLLFFASIQPHRLYSIFVLCPLEIFKFPFETFNDLSGQPTFTQSIFLF